MGGFFPEITTEWADGRCFCCENARKSWQWRWEVKSRRRAVSAQLRFEFKFCGRGGLAKLAWAQDRVATITQAGSENRPHRGPNGIKCHATRLDRGDKTKARS